MTAGIVTAAFFVIGGTAYGLPSHSGTQGKIEKKVVSVYQKIEDAVVSAYQKVEDTFVSGYQKIEDKFTGADKAETPGGFIEKNVAWGENFINNSTSRGKLWLDANTVVQED